MKQTAAYLGFIPLLPLVGALVIGLLHIATAQGKRLPDKLYGLLGCIGPFISLVLAGTVFFALSALDETGRVLTQRLYTWLQVGELQVAMGLVADPLSSLMLLLVTFVGFLIHLYAIGYMAGDKNFGKFFAYLNLFLASMLLLVLGDGPVVMFVGWEGVGLCSYLLISFYSENPANVAAGNKAFIVNRIGDFGFVLGMAMLFWAIGTDGFDFISLETRIASLSPTLGLAIGLLLFVGAAGKSAQIPLYIWLPDAMAGPTPVSALIHAATMVTAGVYMIARFSFLYAQVPLAGEIIAWVGILTALLAAVFAIYQRDLKKILAYSTVSQLGYMFAAVGLSAYSAGIFHVFTHAFFKALLFLGAGSVIHALHQEQDIWKMGGLRQKLPITYGTMLLGALALAGCPLFSGFFSKDEILYTALSHGYFGIWFIGLVVAGITAYYTFRLVFVVFHGTPADQALYDKVHESPPLMTVPLVILAIAATFAGLLNLPGLFGGHLMISHWLSPSLAEHHLAPLLRLELVTAGGSIIVFVLGVTIAYRKFGTRAQAPVYRGFHRFAEKKFMVDELLTALFVTPYCYLAQTLSKIIEPWITDGPRKSLTMLYRISGRACKVFQVGLVRVYAIYMVLGLSIMSYLLMSTLNL